MEQPVPAFVVIAEFEVAAEHRQEFLGACRYDSKRSVADEPGCRQFDVVTSGETPEVVILYEMYDDRASFDAHLTMPHFNVFADALERLQVKKTQVRFLEREH